MSIFRRRRPQAPADDVRPNVGAVVHSDGTRTELRFIRTDDPLTFIAVTVDGDPVEVESGDQIEVDVLGPGQGVRFSGQPPV